MSQVRTGVAVLYAVLATLAVAGIAAVLVAANREPEPPPTGEPEAYRACRAVDSSYERGVAIPDRVAYMHDAQLYARQAEAIDSARWRPLRDGIDFILTQQFVTDYRVAEPVRAMCAPLVHPTTTLYHPSRNP